MSQRQEQFQSSIPGAISATPSRNGGPPDEPVARPPLGLWDAVSIIVGIVVGAGIYQTAPFILKHTESPGIALLAWAGAGVLSLVGALCYAELATTYPRDGGDIVYLSRAFGRWAGFLFGWVQLTVILTGSIGMMAFVFASYAIRFCEAAFGFQLGIISAFCFAGGAILLLTLTNVLGLVFGKTVQNVLTVAKILGLLLIIAAGFIHPTPGGWSQPGLSPQELQAATFPGFTASLGVALILILYTYGGWNDAAFVAAEVRDGKKNITRALVLGILIITALYLLVNAAYINSQGFPGAQRSTQIAADVLNRGFGRGGETLMCVLVMTSALGAVNGLIFTGARVYSTVGKDYSILSWMSGWDRKHAAPIPALVTQGVLALALVFLVGTTSGRDGINRVLEATAIGGRIVEAKAEGVAVPKLEIIYLLKPMEWENSYLAGMDLPSGKKAAELAKGGFDTLLTCTAPIFWLFFLLTGLSLFVLRFRDRGIERPFRVPLYPVPPILFCFTCGYMLYASGEYSLSRGWQGGLFLLGVLPLLVGLPLYLLCRPQESTR
jgi:amino acid transporter